MKTPEEVIPFSVGAPHPPPRGSVYVAPLTKLKTSEMSAGAGVLETSVLTHQPDDTVTIGARLELSFDDITSARCAIEAIHRDGLQALDQFEAALKKAKGEGIVEVTDLTTAEAILANGKA